jgi:sialic acid synthase SpsE
MRAFKINGKLVGDGHPTYFIADIAANHDGDLERAKDLIRLAKDAGADAAKFQHFRAETIVSGEGFEKLGTQVSHQSKWKKSVVEVYKKASVPWNWTEELVATCKECEIDFFTSPYDLEMIDQIDPYVPAYKVGSGDITWLESIRKMASKGKPVLLAAGASNLVDVQRAMSVLIDEYKTPVLLMQCNTNYTASLDNFRYIRLRVLETFKAMFPDVPLGLSDHTPGHATVLGAVALGACAIEKHFTDNVEREGPDHAFAMDPKAWSEMVARTRELEAALGDGNKQIEDNELDTVIVQRRCIRAAKDLPAGRKIERADLTVLRPAPAGSIPPYDLPIVIGATLSKALKEGELLCSKYFE